MGFLAREGAAECPDAGPESLFGASHGGLDGFFLSKPLPRTQKPAIIIEIIRPWDLPRAEGNL